MPPPSLPSLPSPPGRAGPSGAQPAPCSEPGFAWAAAVDRGPGSARPRARGGGGGLSVAECPVERALPGSVDLDPQQQRLPLRPRRRRHRPPQRPQVPPHQRRRERAVPGPQAPRHAPRHLRHPPRPAPARPVAPPRGPQISRRDAPAAGPGGAVVGSWAARALGRACRWGSGLAVEGGGQGGGQRDRIERRPTYRIREGTRHAGGGGALAIRGLADRARRRVPLRAERGARRGTAVGSPACARRGQAGARAGRRPDRCACGGAG